MFCACGTILMVPEYGSVIICPRCSAENEIDEIKPIIITKNYKIEIEKEAVKTKGAKIKHQCPECGSEEMTYNAIQLRSVDEGQTIFYECDCGYKMKMDS
ncbi:DNA-directed RNA polymerase I subunit RPA12 [Astathelohania contejeani]|uniref:DNA-directed RNA polymerase I subunit RPA12 n=1 Tax=Astathelohania contejeani TaxID=164912 RepID=A0ABQ7HYE9_9MICR|nr:DNA-directed RNA polymerase I subunit RPA12 [Thelohania contejeani]